MRLQWLQIPRHRLPQTRLRPFVQIQLPQFSQTLLRQLILILLRR